MGSSLGWSSASPTPDTWPLIVAATIHSFNLPFTLQIISSGVINVMMLFILKKEHMVQLLPPVNIYTPAMLTQEQLNYNKKKQINQRKLETGV